MKKTITTTILLSIIFSFFFVFCVFFFIKIFINGSSEYIYQGYAAFLGAFLAFLFVRLAEFFERIRNRQKMAYNEIVTLDSVLNVNYGILHDNLFLIDNFIKALTEAKAHIGSIHQFYISNDYLTNLINMYHINRLFSLFTDLRRMNNDIDTSNAWNVELRTAYTQKNITIEEYKLNAQELVKKLSELKKHLVVLGTEIEEVAVENRIIMQKEKPMFLGFTNLIFGSDKIKFSAEEKNIEKEKFKNEVDALQKKSQEKINKAYETTI